MQSACGHIPGSSRCTSTSRVPTRDLCREQRRPDTSCRCGADGSRAFPLGCRNPPRGLSGRPPIALSTFLTGRPVA